MTTKFKRTDREQLGYRRPSKELGGQEAVFRVKLTVQNGRKISALGLGTRGWELEPYPVSPEELGYMREAQSGTKKTRIQETREPKIHPVFCLTTVDNMDINNKRNYKKYTQSHGD